MADGPAVARGPGEAEQRTPDTAKGRAGGGGESPHDVQVVTPALTESGPGRVAAPRQALSPAVVLALNRTAGNQAVAELLEPGQPAVQRAGTLTDIADYTGVTSVPDLYRAATYSNRQWIDRALKSKNAHDVKYITNFNEATKSERLDLVDILVHQAWAGAVDEYALENIWRTFGNDVTKVASESPRNTDLWKKSVAKGADLYALPAFAELRNSFKRDVKALANQYLLDNARATGEEQIKLGLKAEPAPEGRTADVGQRLQQEHADRLAEIRWLVAQMDRVRKAQIALEDIMVGFRSDASYSPWYFDPGAPPPIPASTVAADSLHIRLSAGYNPRYVELARNGMANWAEVKAVYDGLQGILFLYADRSPALFGALGASTTITGNWRNERDGSPIREAYYRKDVVGDLAKQQSPEAARALAATVLNDLLANIAKSTTMLATDKLAYEELEPIHQQLFAGKKVEGGTVDWSNEYNKGVGEALVSKYKSKEFWITLGLGTLTAAAFIFSELASGGLATFAWASIGVGLGATQAVRSWQSWDELTAAAGTAAKSESDLVRKEQAQAALVSAILDTAFVLIDTFGPVAKAGLSAIRAERIASAGAKAAGLEGLAAFGRLSVKETGAAEAKLVARAVNEVGIAETIKRTGKSAEELAQIAGKSDAKMAERISEYAKAVEAAGGALSHQMSLATALRNLEKVAKTEGLAKADSLMNHAIDEFGPWRTVEMAGGWKQVSRTLGKDASSGMRLFERREEVWKDLEKFIQSQATAEDAGETLIQRTGTVEDFMNDMDMSTLGAHATENQAKAMQFLASRIGCPATPDALQAALFAQVFTDPTRMHLYDFLEVVDREIGPAAREEVARAQAFKELEYTWGRRIAAAEEHGNSQLAAKLREQASKAGVDPTAYKAIGSKDVVTVSKELDALHQEFKAGTTQLARKKELAVEIADRQAMINAQAGGGYATAGGVRRFASQREGQKLIDSFKPAASTTFLPTQRLGALIDQLPELDEYIMKLEKAGSDAEIRDAVRALGKYGERCSQLSGEALESMPELPRLTERFLAIKKAASAGSRDLETLTREAKTAFNELERVSLDAITRIQEQAALRGTPGAMQQAEKLIRYHAKVLRLKDSLYRQYVNAGRAVRVGQEARKEN